MPKAERIFGIGCVFAFAMRCWGWLHSGRSVWGSPVFHWKNDKHRDFQLHLASLRCVFHYLTLKLGLHCGLNLDKA